MESKEVEIKVRCEECGVMIFRRYSWSYDLTEEDEGKLIDLTMQQHMRLHRKADEADNLRERLNLIKNSIRGIIGEE